MRKTGFFLLLYFASCVLKLPLSKGIIEFNKEDKNIRIHGSLDIEGVIKDGFPYPFKKNHYVLWLEILNTTPETLNLKCLIKFKDITITPIAGDEVESYFKFTTADRVATILGGIFLGGIAVTLFASPLFLPYALYKPNTLLLPWAVSSLIIGGWISYVQINKAEKEERENIKKIKKYYKAYAPPGYSKLLFIFQRKPFKRIIIEYKGENFSGKFEVLK